MNCNLSKETQISFISTVYEDLLYTVNDPEALKAFKVKDYIKNLNEVLTETLEDQETVLNYMMLLPEILFDAQKSTDLSPLRKQIGANSAYLLDLMDSGLEGIKKELYPKQKKKTVRKTKNEVSSDKKDNQKKSSDGTSVGQETEEGKTFRFLEAKPSSPLTSTGQSLQFNADGTISSIQNPELVFYYKFLETFHKAVEITPGNDLSQLVINNHKGFKIQIRNIRTLPVEQRKSMNQEWTNYPVVIFTDLENNILYFNDQYNISTNPADGKPIYFETRNVVYDKKSKRYDTTGRAKLQSAEEVIQTHLGGKRNTDEFKKNNPDAYAIKWKQIDDAQQAQLAELYKINKYIQELPEVTKKKDALVRDIKDGAVITGEVTWNKNHVYTINTDTGQKYTFFDHEGNAQKVDLNKKATLVLVPTLKKNNQIFKDVVTVTIDGKLVGYVQESSFEKPTTLDIGYEGVSKGYINKETNVNTPANQVNWAESDIQFTPQVATSKDQVRNELPGQIVIRIPGQTSIAVQTNNLSNEDVNMLIEVAFNQELKVPGKRVKAGTAITPAIRKSILESYLILGSERSNSSNVSLYDNGDGTYDLKVDGEKIDFANAAQVEQAKTRMRELLTEPYKPGSSYNRVQYRVDNTKLVSNSDMLSAKLEDNLITTTSKPAFEVLKERTAVKVVVDANNAIKFSNGYLKFSLTPESERLINGQLEERDTPVIDQEVTVVTPQNTVSKSRTKTKTKAQQTKIDFEETAPGEGTIKIEYEQDPDDSLLMRKNQELAPDTLLDSQAKQWVKESPLFNFVKLETLFDVVNSEAYGQFKNGVITLWQGADYTVAYHEGWHAFAQHFLTKQEKIDLYKAVAKTEAGKKALAAFAKENKVDLSELSDIQKYYAIEELIAEDFRQYMLSDGKLILSKEPKRNTIFRRILNFIKALFNKQSGEARLQELYNNLRVGNLNRYTPSHTNAMFGESALYMLKNVPGVTTKLAKQDQLLIVESMSGYMAEVINDENTKRGDTRFTTAVFRNPEVWLPYVYNKVKEKMSAYRTALLEEIPTLEGAEKIEAENNLNLLNEALVNYGNVNEGFIAYHLEKNTILTQSTKDLDVEAFSKTQEDIENTRFDKSGNELSSVDLASNQVLFLVNTIRELTSTGEVVKNKLGAPKLVRFNKSWGLLKTILMENSESPRTMKEALEEEAKYNPWVYDLLNKLGTVDAADMASNGLVHDGVFDLWTNFWQAFNLVNISLYQVNVNQRSTELQGTFNYEILMGYSSASYRQVARDFSSYFKTVSDNPFIIDTESGNVLSFQAKDSNGQTLLEKYSKGFKDVSDKLEFLKDIGMPMTDNVAVRRALDDTAKDPINLKFLLDTLLQLNRNGIPVTDIVKDLMTTHTLTEFNQDGQKQTRTIVKGQNTTLSKLFTIEAKYSGDYANVALTTADGETKFEQSQMSTLAQQVKYINNAETFEDLINLPHMKHLAADRFLEAPGNSFLRSLFVYNEDTKTFGAKRKNAKITIDDLSGVQTIIDDAYANYDLSVSTSKSDRYTRLQSDIYAGLISGKFSTMVHADKSTTLSYSVGEVISGVDKKTKHLHIDPSDFITKMGDFTEGMEKAYVLLLPYIEAELQRIAKVKKHNDPNDPFKMENILGVTVPNSKGKMTGDKFQLISGIFTQDTLNKLLELETVDNISDEFSNDLIKELNLYFLKKADETYAMLQGTMFIDNNLKQVVTSTMDTTPSENALKKAIFVGYQVNYFFHQASSLGLFYGNISEYKMEKDDFHKRNAAVASTGGMFRTDEDAINFINTHYGFKYAESKGITSQPFTTSMNTAILEDQVLPSKIMSDPNTKKILIQGFIDKGYTQAKALEKAEKIISAYQGMEVGDAQGWITFDGYRILRKLRGKWSAEQEALYQQIIKDPSSINTEDVKTYFPAEKYQYYGPLDTETYNATAFHKFSLMPLIPTLIEGTELEDLHNNWMENNIIYGTHQTGSKVSTIVADEATTADKWHKAVKEGTTPEFKFTPNRVFLHYLKNQLDINSKYKNKVIFSTQMRKLIEEGLFINGRAIDQMSQNMVNRYEKAIESYIALRKAELEKELGIELGKPEMIKENTEKLVRFIQKELTRQDLPEHHIDFIKVDSEGKLQYDLSISLNSTQIEQALLSIVNNRLVRQKVNGEALVQLSNSMLNQRAATEEEKEKWGTLDLNFYQPNYFADGRTLAAEIKISMQGNFQELYNIRHKDGKPVKVYDTIITVKKDGTKKFTKKINEKKSLARLNETIKDPEWRAVPENLEMITITGVRIPVQGLNSMEYFAVKEFLPSYAGNVIVPPAEIVAKSGSDFDIDKLSMLMPNLKTYGNQVKMIKPLTDSVNAVEAIKRTDEIKQEIKELRKEKNKAVEVFDKALENIKDESLTPEQMTELNTIKAAYYDTRAIYKQELEEYNKELETLINLKQLSADQKERLEALPDKIEKANVTLDLLLQDYKISTRNFGAEKFKERRERIEANEGKVLKDLEDKIVALQIEADALSPKAYENQMQLMISSILSMPSNYISLVTPNSTDLFTDKGGLVEQLSENRQYKSSRHVHGEQAYEFIKGQTSATNVLEPAYNIDKHESNAVGKDVLGIGAVANTFNTLFNRVGMYLNAEKTVYGKNYRVKLLLKHNNLNGRISLSDIYDANKENKTSDTNKISDVISQLMNGWVDVAKDAWIFDVQGNKQVGPVLLFLVEAGVPLKDAVYFVSNPLVKDYVAQIKKEESPFYQPLNPGTQGSAQTRAKRKILESLGIDPKRKQLYAKTLRATENLNLSTENLIAMSKSTTYSEDVIGAFLHYLEVESHAGDVTSLRTAFNFDTSKQVTLFDIVNKQAAVQEQLQNSIFPPQKLQALLENSPIGPFSSVGGFQVNLWSDLFTFYNNPVMTEYLRDLIVRESRLMKNMFNEESRYIQTFKNDLLVNMFISELKPHNTLDKSEYKGVPITTSSTQAVPVSTSVNEKGEISFSVNPVLLQAQFDKQLFTATASTNNLSYKALKLATLPFLTFSSVNASGFYEFVNFTMERELQRVNNPKELVQKTLQFEQKVKDLNDKFSKPDTMTEERFKTLVDDRAYEEILRDKALEKTYNFAYLFNGSNSYAAQFINIKNQYPELSKRYDLIADLIVASSTKKVTSDTKKLKGQKEQFKNLSLRDNRTSKDKFEIYEANMRELTDSSTNLIEIKTEKDRLENERLVEFFKMLPYISLLQSGFDTTNSLSFIKAMPQDEIAQIMQRAINNTEITESLLTNFTTKFNAQNAMSNVSSRKRLKNYVPLGTLSKAKIVSATQPSTQATEVKKIESDIENIVTNKLKEKIFRIGKIPFEKTELDDINVYVKKKSDSEFSIAIDNKGKTIFGLVSAVLDFQRRDLENTEIYVPNPKGFILWDTFLKSDTATQPKSKIILDNKYSISLGTLKALKNNSIESIHFPERFFEDFKNEYTQFLKQEFSTVGFTDITNSRLKTIKISIDNLIKIISLKEDAEITDQSDTDETDVSGCTKPF